jgi:DNA mismatch endonuclease (patch repair protein)
MTDVFSPEKRSEVMSKIRGKWTTPERVIHGYLKGRKIPHEMHPNIIGNPDVRIKGTNLVIFIDGNFWHGKDYNRRKKKLQPFWRDKIHSNMCRDKRHVRLLRSEGWRVMRFWEDDVLKRPEWTIKKITSI